MRQDSKSDNDLMREYSECSFIAYNEIERKYRKNLFNYLICGLVKDRDDAEDIVQETMVRIYKSKFTYKPTFMFSTWAYRICRNLALNFKRDKRTINLDMISDNETMEDDNPEFIIDLEKKEVSDKMKKALESLDKKYQEIITLRYLRELSYEEISEITGININTLKSHCKRGIEILRKAMEL